MSDYMALSLMGFGMVVAHVAWNLLTPRPEPKARLAEVIELSRYRRR